jgi:predicted transcriptional regulator
MVAPKSRPHHNLSETEFVRLEAERFAAAFVRWREDSQTTQKTIADKLGISPALLSAVETGRTRPSFEILAVLRREMGLRSLAL